MFLNEHLVDIADDLFDYEKDVERNSFNILRCFVREYGKEASLYLADRIGKFEKAYEIRLKSLPDPVRSAHVKRERSAMEESKAHMWEFPPLILDERSYRAAS
mmetsp:Transcript_2787/g.4263  ORF Transcript_2787/g.4263 Transcript_2787/m.4263 type:complete len:103 (+) Transcript_2787:418-726(+)